MQLEGKVALVTGAGSGIGRAAAELFAQEGARVAVLSDTEAEIVRAAQEIRDKYKASRALPLTADVSQPDQMQQAIKRIGDEWDRLDIVFANAGINGVWAPLDELKPEEWDQTLNINLKGTFLTVKYALPYLKRQGGSIIVTSSVNGTRIFSNPGATAYSCSKAGQVAFTKMMAVELAQYGIRANVICPGSIQTNIAENSERRDTERVTVPFQDSREKQTLIKQVGGGSGSPMQVARLALFLASDASSHISGAQIFIDAGQSLL